MWNVLVVDDSPLARALLARTVEKLGHRVILADCGQRALEICALVRPDIMLLDVMMPDIDGWELAARLRENAGLRGVPVVFQSSLETPEEIARCAACGAVAIVSTPVRIHRLAEIFTQQLGSWPKAASPSFTLARPSPAPPAPALLAANAGMLAIA